MARWQTEQPRLGPIVPDLLPVRPFCAERESGVSWFEHRLAPDRLDRCTAEGSLSQRGQTELIEQVLRLTSDLASEIAAQGEPGEPSPQLGLMALQSVVACRERCGDIEQSRFG